MGMSSSQARLLSLTARQHDVEWRAQKLQAEKLQLANDSDHVYNKYLRELNATKIQTRIYDEYNGDSFVNASLAILEHGLLENPTGKTAAVPLFLQEFDENGGTTILVTKAIANQYGITESTTPYPGTLDDFLTAELIPNDNYKKVVGEYDAGGTWSEDKSNVTGITINAKNNASAFHRGINPAAVENSADSTDTTVYDNFTHKPDGSTEGFTRTDTTSITDITTVSSLSSGQTYKITDAAGLNKLKTLVNGGANTNGVTIIMGSDIDMKDITWDGINNFNGTFDGNGYLIKNLNGSKGLFNTINASAVIKNVGLKDVNISGSSTTGGIASLSSGGKVYNCFVTGTITGGAHTGGITGENMNGGTIEDCNVKITLSGGGSCVGGISGHNSGTVDGCHATGTVHGSNWVGGLVGHNTGTTVIKDSITSVDVTGSSQVGHVIGYDDGANLTITNITYNNDGTLQICGNRPDTDWTSGTFKTQIAAPFINTTDWSGDFYNNVLAAYVKAKGIDITDNAALADAEQKCKDYVKNIYGAGSDTDLFNIVNINSFICNWVNRNTDTDGFAAALVTDVDNGITNSTRNTKYQGVYTTDRYNVSMSATDTGYNAINNSNGVINIPAKSMILANLKAALELAGCPEYAAQAESFINSYDTNVQADKATLAYINELVTDYAEGRRVKEFMDVLLEAVKTNETSASFNGKMPTIIADPAHLPNYTINVGAAGGGTPNINYDKTYTPNMQPKKDWDYSLKEVQDKMKEYLLRQSGIRIVEDAEAYSEEWLTNYVQSGQAQFCYFDIESALADGKVDPEKLAIVGTSVANETSLQEVQDKVQLNAAEATYERDMKKINKKETKVDTELQKLEAERSSIKTEQDDLKTVINDNVNLTFKLFS